MEHSYRQPNLVTLVIGEHGTVSATQQDGFDWSLYTFDKNNEKQHQYKLHTLDVYLWTPSDASIFVDALQKVIKEDQFTITDVSGNLIATQGQSSNAPASGLVQRMEQMAMDKPHMGSATGVMAAQSHQRTDSYSLQPSTNTNRSQTPGSDPPYSRPLSSQATDAQDYKPIPYNPAAPAAPEPIAHREKTPPPVDAGNGIGLIGPTPPITSPGYPPSDSQSYIPSATTARPGPPHQYNSTNSGFSPSPSVSPLGSQQGVQSFAPPPTQPQPFTPLQNPGQGVSPVGYPPYQPQPQQPQQGSAPYNPYPQQVVISPFHQGPAYSGVGGVGAPGTPGVLAGPGSPGISGGPGVYDPHQGQPSPQQQPGILQPQQQPQPQNPYAVHQQHYQPAYGGQTSFGGGPGGGGRLEKNAQMLEKGVNRFLKKLDKKF